MPCGQGGSGVTGFARGGGVPHQNYIAARVYDSAAKPKNTYSAALYELCAAPSPWPKAIPLESPRRQVLPLARRTFPLRHLAEGITPRLQGVPLKPL